MEREDFEIGYVIGYEDLVLSVVYDMTQIGQYKPWNDCGNLFLAATESTKLLHFSANGIQQAYNRIVFWYASFEQYIFYSGY